MSWQSFILGVVAVFVVLKLRQHLRKQGVTTLDDLIENILRIFSSEPQRAPAPDLPVPEPVVEIKPPDYGNIRPIRGEEQDPEILGPDIHEFPEMKTAVTRFEDFNRRLFILGSSKEDRDVWPNTTADDFATRIRGMTREKVQKEIHLRLRPRYPVIFDTHGFWTYASAQLEQDPDYTDAVVSTYLNIPVDSRPVVVSVSTPDENPALTFMRYGFQDFRITTTDTRFHQAACLAFLMHAQFGPREGWLWLSVARLRQTVIRAFEATEAKKRENQATQYMVQQAEAAKRETEHKNRFVTLWRNRLPASPASLPAPSNNTPEAAE